MIELFSSAFVTLFVVIDPPGCAPIFAGLVKDADTRHQHAMAIRASLVATLILVGFALFGEELLAALHIELAAFRIAGGILLFLIALEMLFEKRTQRREQRAQQVRNNSAALDDVAVFPVAMPMLAGPGAIASIMLLMAHAEGMAASLAVLAALGAVMAITLATLLAAAPLLRLMGAQVSSVMTRLLGLLLAALAAQFVVDGIKGAFGI